MPRTLPDRRAQEHPEPAAAGAASADLLRILYGRELEAYAFPEPHPFGAARLPGFWKEFCRRGLERRVAVEAPENCDEGTLRMFHTKHYVRRVRSAAGLGEAFLDAGDTPAFPGVYQAACTVVGSTLKAVRLIMEGRCQRAFCPIAGLHHAARDRASGFCVFNDIGVAIEVLRRRHGLRRIGYVDIDAHHGDGVYYAFASDPHLFIADIHEDGSFLFPGTGGAEETGVGAAAGSKLNLPLPPGAGEAEFMAAFAKAEAFLDERRPELILLQCGADSVAGDPIAHLAFSPRCHSWAAGRLRALAQKHAKSRLLAMGGGGYLVSNLAETWCAVVEALL
jgi:acetoin utilization protein AcuC